MKRYLSSIVYTAMFLAALIPETFGQQSGTTTGTGGGTTTTNVPATPPPKVPPPPVIVTPPTLELPPREIHPIFISGMVMREDGSEPPFGAIIEMDCGGSKTREAIVSPNGQFTFQYGGARKFSDIVPDASDGIGYINDEDSIYWSPTRSGNARIQTTTPLYIRLSGCDLRAQLSGYQSSVLRLNGATLTSVNDVGWIVVYPTERVQGTVISAASLSAPKTARKLLNRAQKAFQKEKFEECEDLLKEAIAEHPKYSEAWLLRGQVYQKQRQFANAREYFEKAIETDALYVTPYLQLGWLYSLEQMWQESLDVTDKALDLDPVNFPDAYYLNALANYNLKNWDRSLKRAEQSIRRDMDHLYPKAHLILANIYSLKNDPSGARSEMMKYLKYAPNAPDAQLVRARLDRPAAASGTPQ